MSLPVLARLSLALCAVSLVFPIAGGLFVASAPPRWLGVLDVVIAASYFASAALIVARAQRRVADPDRIISLRMSQVIVSVIPVLLVAYFVVGERVSWTVLIIGLAWRAWLLHYSMPSLVAALRQRAP
jgi:hypothetical protein